jgi:hypothetical protein
VHGSIVWALHYTFMSYTGRRAWPPPLHSSHPNEIARIPPAMCDGFGSPSLFVWPNMKGRGNLWSLQPMKMNHTPSNERLLSTKIIRYHEYKRDIMEYIYTEGIFIIVDKIISCFSFQDLCLGKILRKDSQVLIDYAQCKAMAVCFI